FPKVSSLKHGGAVTPDNPAKRHIPCHVFSIAIFCSAAIYRFPETLLHK
ncbi:hypothetical protein ECEC1736_2808, partial [Escherichia coli EC1736]